MNWIAWTILGFLLADYLLDRLADRLNLNAITDEIPAPFAGVFDPEQYRQAQAYLRSNTRLKQVAATVGVAVLLLFWFSGGFGGVDDWVRDLGWHPLITAVAYIGILAGLKALAGLPFSLYATFGIEARFGFNQSSLATWIMDRLKSVLLVVVVGGPLVTGVVALFQYVGPTAWIWCWALIALFAMLVQFVAPTWIMPLFNRFDPLPHGELRSAIQAYARSIDFSMNDIYIMDGSRRSSKSNAFFTGLGCHRRIVLFDTLVARHTTAELVAVLAHEMGHYQMRHILKMSAMGVAQTGLMLYLLSRFLHLPALYEAFYVPTPSVHAGLVCFAILYQPLEAFLTVIGHSISRRYEFAADRFAAATTGSRPLIDALKKLSVDNLSNLKPHPLYVFFNYSHPPVLQRIAALTRHGPKCNKVTGRSDLIAEACVD